MSEKSIAPLTVANLALLEKQLDGEKKIRRRSERMSQKALSKQQSSVNSSMLEDHRSSRESIRPGNKDSTVMNIGSRKQASQTASKLRRPTIREQISKSAPSEIKPKSQTVANDKELSNGDKPSSKRIESDQSSGQSVGESPHSKSSVGDKDYKQDDGKKLSSKQNNVDLRKSSVGEKTSEPSDDNTSFPKSSNGDKIVKSRDGNVFSTEESNTVSSDPKQNHARDSKSKYENRSPKPSETTSTPKSSDADKSTFAKPKDGNALFSEESNSVSSSLKPNKSDHNSSKPSHDNSSSPDSRSPTGEQKSNDYERPSSKLDDTKRPTCEENQNLSSGQDESKRPNSKQNQIDGSEYKWERNSGQNKNERSFNHDENDIPSLKQNEEGRPLPTFDEKECSGQNEGERSISKQNEGERSTSNENENNRHDNKRPYAGDARSISNSNENGRASSQSIEDERPSSGPNENDSPSPNKTEKELSISNANEKSRPSSENEATTLTSNEQRTTKLDNYAASSRNDGMSVANQSEDAGEKKKTENGRVDPDAPPNSDRVDPASNDPPTVEGRDEKKPVSKPMVLGKQALKENVAETVRERPSRNSKESISKRDGKDERDTRSGKSGKSSDPKPSNVEKTVAGQGEKGGINTLTTGRKNKALEPRKRSNAEENKKFGSSLNLKTNDDDRSSSRTPIKIPQVANEENQNTGKTSGLSRNSRASGRTAEETEGDSTSVLDEDDDDDEEDMFGEVDDDETETEWSSVKDPRDSQPVSRVSRYSSSINSVISSIQTPRSYVSTRMASMTPSRTSGENRVPSKMSQGLTESSFVISRRNSYADPSGRETRNRSRLTRDGSHVSNRNNSRWSQYSEGGYSISSRRGRSGEVWVKGNHLSAPGTGRSTRSRVNSREASPSKYNKVRKTGSEASLRKSRKSEKDGGRSHRSGHGAKHGRKSRPKSEPALVKQNDFKKSRRFSEAGDSSKARAELGSRKSTGKLEPVKQKRIPKKKDRRVPNRPDTRGSTTSIVSSKLRRGKKEAWGGRRQPTNSRKPRMRRSGSFASISSAASIYTSRQAKFLEAAYLSGYEAGMVRSRSRSVRSGSEYSYTGSGQSSMTSLGSDMDDYESYPSVAGSRVSSRRSSNADSIHLSSVHPSEFNESARDRGGVKLPQIVNKNNQKFRAYGIYHEPPAISLPSIKPKTEETSAAKSNLNDQDKPKKCALGAVKQHQADKPRVVSPVSDSTVGKRSRRSSLSSTAKSFHSSLKPYNVKLQKKKGRKSRKPKHDKKEKDKSSASDMEPDEEEDGTRRPPKAVRVHKVNHPLPDLEKATRDKGLSRIEKLAQPKQSKSVYLTSFKPYKWGDQGTLWPMNPAALTAEPSPRVTELAQSKKDHLSPDQAPRPIYVMDIDSVIWEVSPGAMNAVASKRVTDLAKPKSTPAGFQEQRRADGTGRSSPIWHVSEAAKNAEERSRTNELAKPKTVHSHYSPGKPLPTPVAENAKKGHASSRVEHLARPKSRKEKELRNPEWAIPKSALNATPKQRTLELAQAKQHAIGYREPLEPDRQVSRAALRTVPTARIEVLARPVIRGTNKA